MRQAMRFVIAIMGMSIFAIGCAISIDHTMPGLIIALTGTVINVVPITWRD